MVLSIKAQVKEVRELGEFTSVTVSAGIDLIVEQGENTAVIAEAKDNDILETIITETEGSTLKIYSKFKGLVPGNRTVYVTIKNIELINASGGSDVKTPGTIKVNDIELNASGGSDLNINIEAVNLICKVSGGSDAYFKGKAEKFDVKASGGSDVKAMGFEAKICNAEASGGSDIYVHALNQLSVNANGGSDVFYSGEPTIVSLNTGGGSDIHKNN